MFLTARRLAALEADTEIQQREIRQLRSRIIALESRMELRAQDIGLNTVAIAGLRNLVERLAAKVARKKMPSEVISDAG